MSIYIREKTVGFFFLGFYSASVINDVILYSNMLLSSTLFALMEVLYKSIVLTVLGSTTIEDICRKI